MSGVAAARTVAAPRAPAPVVQRRCACGAKREDECQECKAKRVQRLPADTAAARATTVPPIVNAVLQSAGSPLDAPTRKWFEERFERDFSNVRIHTDDRAAESARAVNALAYTSGANIVFAPGLYSVQSERGRRLLAHELTHVVQQRASLSPGGVTAPDDAAEREAEWNAARVDAGDVLTFRTSPRAVSRQQADAEPPLAFTPCNDEQRSVINPSLALAREWLNDTIAALGRPVAIQDALVRHFGASDADTARSVREHLGDIQGEIRRFTDTRETRDYSKVAFVTECQTAADPVCRRAMAHVRGSRIIFCPGFFDDPSVEGRTSTLIHEVSHTLGTVDRGYSHERMLEVLSPEERLDNADSYAMFAREVGTNEVVAGTAPRDEVENCTEDVARQLREAVAHADRWNSDALEETEETGAEATRGLAPIFDEHLGNARPETREAAARVFRATHSGLLSPLNVVCDEETTGNCSSSHRVYSQPGANNIGLGAGLGAAIGGGVGLGVGIGLAAALGASLGAGIGIGLGLSALGALTGLLIGIGVGIATSHGPSLHVCPSWRTLDRLDGVESMLAALYERFGELSAADSRKHAALARALHDRVSLPPVSPGEER